MQLCQECKKLADPKAPDVVQCVSCQKRYHEKCYDPPISADIIRHRPAALWRCANCKMCEHCQAAGDEDLLLICEMCDQAVHTTCMQPPLA